MLEIEIRGPSKLDLELGAEKIGINHNKLISKEKNVNTKIHKAIGKKE